MKLETIKGQRISLVLPTKTDAPRLYKYLSNRDVNRWLPRVPKPYTLKHAHEWINSAPKDIKNDERLPYSIRHNELGHIIGGISLAFINRIDKSAELGYWIASEFWGEGYACEAGRLLCKYAFSQKQKFHRVYAWVHSENPGSIRVLEKLGFVKEGHCRKATKITGRWKDDYLYAILKSDFMGR